MSNEQARAERDAGIQVAADHANRVIPDWQEAAYASLQHYLWAMGSGHTFTSEDFREVAHRHGLPKPPHLRAYGYPFQRAAKAGLIVKAGHTTARAAHVHCSILTLWRVA